MKDFDSKLNAFFNGLDDVFKKHTPNMIAETATEHYHNALITKSWDGQPYAPYKNKKREPSRGSLMMRSNQLKMSIKPSLISANKVVISAGNSRVKYARIHNEGGRVSGTRNIRQYTNRNFMGRGKQVNIRSHQRGVEYYMPQRQFMGKNASLLRDIKTRFQTLKQHIK